MAKLPEIKFSLAEDSFSIQYKMSEAYSNMKNPHAHTFYEIFYVLSGAKTYTIQGTTMEVNKGDLVFIPPEQLHQTFGFAPVHCERILINFSQHFVDAELVRASFERLYQQVSRPVVRFDQNEQTAVEHLLGKMLHEAKTHEPGNTELVRALLLELLIRIHRLELRSQHSPVAQKEAHPLRDKILEIVDYITKHYDQPHSLNHLAQSFYISPSHLSRSFKQITGVPFREYLQNIRIREAQNMLRDTDIPIQAIGERAGFANAPNFNVVFKKCTGHTPGQYRRLTSM